MHRLSSLRGDIKVPSWCEYDRKGCSNHPQRKTYIFKMAALMHQWMHSHDMKDTLTVHALILPRCWYLADILQLATRGHPSSQSANAQLQRPFQLFKWAALLKSETTVWHWLVWSWRGSACDPSPPPPVWRGGFTRQRAHSGGDERAPNAFWLAAQAEWRSKGTYAQGHMR